MNDFYLVQRLRRPINIHSKATGFDSHFSCEYMGSAEFEYGNVAASLKRLRSGAIIPTACEIGDGVSVYFIHAFRNLTVVDDFMEWATNPKRPFWSKEPTYFPDVLNGATPDYVDTVAWWDISSDVLFTLDADVADEIFLAVRGGQS